MAIQKRKHRHPAKRAKTVGKVAAPARTVVVAGTKKRHKKRVSGLTAHRKPMDIFKILVGSVAGGSIGAIIYNKVPGSPLVKGGAQLIAGGAGMMYIPQNSNFLFGLATGVATGGGVNLMHSTGIMHGVDEMVSGLFDNLSGYEREIPAQTSGHYSRGSRHSDQSHGHHHHHHIQEGDILNNQSGYMAGAPDKTTIDMWVAEGVPGVGGDDWAM